MVKMLVCLVCAMGLAVMTLQLRQQRLELNYKISQLHRQVESHQAKLWNQQLQIAVYTAPNAIQQTVNNRDLHMVPRAPIPRGQAGSEAASWIEDPDAE
jgi:cell division protein FtsL